MREIKFRGYSKKYKKWVYGCLDITADGKYFIKEINERGASQRTRVEEDSVGQFTGQLDSENLEVFEGDYLRNDMSGFIHKVVWCEETSEFIIINKECEDVYAGFDEYYGTEFTVVGNMYEEKLNG